MGSYIVVPDPATHDLVFHTTDGAPAPSEEENLLVTEIERTLRVVRNLFEQRPAELLAQFENLTALARAGLTGPQAQPVFARRMLVEFKAAILEREAGPRKNRYMATLGAACLRASLPFALVGVGAWVATTQLTDAATVSALALASNFAFVLAACCAGVWVSYGARKAQFTFEDLTVVDGDYLYPSSRLAFACLLTAALTLIFHAGAAQVAIGSASTSSVLKSPVIALIVGFVCGFSEQVLAKTMADQAARIVGKSITS